MCDPVTLTAVAIGATLMQSYGQYQAGNSQAKSTIMAAENNNKIAEYNAKIQDLNASYKDKAAVDSLGRGAEEGAKLREQARAANATGKANAAGGGLLVDTGTVGDLQDQNIGTGEVNALTAQNNGEREAYGYKVGASGDRAEATNLRYQGQVGLQNANYQAKVIKSNARTQALTTLVSGVATAGMGYYNATSSAGSTAANTAKNKAVVFGGIPTY